MIKKIILGAVAGILSCSATFSQSGPRHELSVWGGGGLSTLNYSTEIGDSKLRGGGSFGLGYNYGFNDRWSINTGLEFSFYNSKVNGSEFSDRYDTNDGEYDFQLRSDVVGYIEKQKAIYLNIPIMAQYELPLSDHKFYASGGFKVGLPISGKYKVDRGIIYNHGYYPDRDIIYSDQKFKGFGTFSRAGFEDDLDLKLACMVSLEAGMKWKLPNSLSLYTGAYFDYGLNDIKKDADKRLIGYDPAYDESFTVNSIISSQYLKEGQSTNITDKVIPMSAGIKIRLAFALK